MENNGHKGGLIYNLIGGLAKNKITVYLVIFLITITGYNIFNSLPKEQYPEIVVPQIYVSTFYFGTAPADIENLINKPLEKQIKSEKGVKKITSNALQDVSVIMVEFETDVDVELAKDRVKTAIDKAGKDLPKDLDQDPTALEVNFSEFPIMNINLFGEYPVDKLKSYAEIVQDDLEALPEINRIDIVGALDREIQINLDLAKMKAYSLTFYDIQSAVANENINISGGELNVGNIRRTLRVKGEFRSVEEINNLIVVSGKGSTARLGEIAEVVDSNAERQDFARLNNKPVITLNVIKRGGENEVVAAEKIAAILENLKETKLPEGLNINITADNSERTKADINDLINTVVLGFIFVVFVLMFFMGVRDAIFVGLSVPLSALLAFFPLMLMGLTLNTMVLFAFLLGLGLVVDDAIVVIENTHRIFNQNKKISIVESVKMAASEVFLPVLSGTLTTIAPFVPLLFWDGIIGEFMKYLPLTLIFTLFASLIVSYIMNPVFAISFMKREEENKNIKPTLKAITTPISILLGIALATYLLYFLTGSKNIFGFANLIMLLAILYLFNHFILTPYLINPFQEKALPALKRGYRNLISNVIKVSDPKDSWLYSFVNMLTGFSLKPNASFWTKPFKAINSVFRLFATNKVPLRVILSMFVLLFGTFGLMGIFKPTVVLFPSAEPDYIYIYNVMPIGTDANKTNEVTKEIEKRVFKVIEDTGSGDAVNSVISNVGKNAGDPFNPDRAATPHKSKVTIAFVGKLHRNGVSSADLLGKVRTAVKDIPNTTISVERENNGPPTGKPISLEIVGEDFETLTKIADEAKRKIQNAGIEGIDELKSDLVTNKPEIQVNVNREKANREGISTATVAMALRGALFGTEISKFRDNDDEYPIMLRLQESDRDQIDKLLSMNINYRDMAMGGLFRSVPLASIADISYSTTYSQINRKNNERIVTLSSNTAPGFEEAATDINNQVLLAVSDLELPSGYTIKQGGEQEEQAAAMNFLGMAFLIALVMIYLIMAAQFNSVIKPVILFVTIILSLIGVLLGFTIAGKTFSVIMSGVGIIALAGIVVKNGILLMEFIDELQEKGYSLRDAIIEGGSTRLTPVLLTASSTVLGMIPLAYGLAFDFGALFTELKWVVHTGGDSAVFWNILAWTIIYGLIFSTILTLVVVPCMYYINEKVKVKLWGETPKVETTPSLETATV